MSAAAGGGPVGGRIGDRYLVERLLGRGGSAEVYRAHDERHGRPVALKRLVVTASSRARDRALAFEREYHTLTQLRHPNIVSAYEFGTDEAVPFYTMELLEGEDLRDLPGLSWRRASELLADVASALALIHSRRLVHGDVSARNVRRGRDGRATLIDFGTMTTIGAPAELRGTPPHVAPELDTGQPVDERADLYALGTLGYWLLRGEHAYPARSLHELATAWRSPPQPLARVIDVPEALSELIMSLIALDPVARPSSAAEVLDRLTAIGGWEAREQPAAASAYLASPVLVQREAPMARLAAALDRAAAGQGSALVIEGEAGLGASRLLRELVLRAKTRGALVLSAAAGAAGGAFGVARVLARQLLAGGGVRAEAAAGPHRDLLGGLVPELGGGEALADQPVERRAQLARALGDWFSAVAGDQLLAIAVADIRRCDDASLGFLAALAAASGRMKLVVAATLGDAEVASGALVDGMRARSEAITLAPLDRHGTRAFTESVFGRVPHVERLAEITHELCQGNPLQSLELHRHLVATGAVRYRDGVWSIPQDLVVRDLPSSLDAWFAARIGALDDEARGLAEVLAISRASLTVDDCVAVMDLAPAAVFAALHRLIMARMVVVAGARVSLAQDGVRRALRRDLSADRARQLHGRIGRALLARGLDGEAGTLAAGYHLLQGGDRAAGADLIADAATDTTALFSSTGAEMVQALEAALAEYDRTGREPRRRLLVLGALVRCAFLLDPSLVRHADRAVAALRAEVGLARADELAARHPDEPRAALLRRAMVETARRYHELPPAERGFDVFEGMQQLLSAAFSIMGVGIHHLDIPAVQRVAELVEPLAELGASPASAAHRFLLSVVDAMQGRQDRAQRARHAFIEALRDPALFGGLEEGRRRSLIAAQIHGIGMLESLRGGDAGLRRADELDAMGLEAFAPAAVQIRVLTHLFNGDEARADACRAQLDLLALQRAPAWPLDVWILPYLAGPYDLWGDVIGLRHAVAQLRGVAAEHPGYEPFLRFALGAYHRERGELPAARAELEAALTLAPPGTHVAWAPAIAAHVHTLVCAGEHARAIEEGDRAMARARAEGLAPLWVCGRIEPQLALARAHLGDAGGAAAALDAFILAGERDSMPRPMLGKCHEARALVAILAGDHGAFAEAARRAGACYRATGNRKLIAAHERLWKTAAVARGWTPPGQASQGDVVTM